MIYKSYGLWVPTRYITPSILTSSTLLTTSKLFWYTFAICSKTYLGPATLYVVFPIFKLVQSGVSTAVETFADTLEGYANNEKVSSATL